MSQTQSLSAKLQRGAVAGNAMVLGAIGTVSLGLAVAFVVQLGIPVLAGVCAAGIVGAVMLLFHLTLMRGQRIAELEREVAELWSVIGAKPTMSEAAASSTSGPKPNTILQRAHSTPAPRAGAPSQPAVQAHVPLPEVKAQAAPSALSLAEETALARAMAEPDVEAVASAPPAAAIAESVRALRATADAMRAPPERDREIQWDAPAALQSMARQLTGETTPETSAGPQDNHGHVTPTPASTETLDERLSALADALAADRIDVLLQPILGLKDNATRHYEVSIALRAEDGSALEADNDVDALAGAGILPLIDLAKITRVAELARRLAERGRSGAVFTGLAGESLADEDVLTRVTEIYSARAAITDQLVIALDQHDVRAFSPAHWKVLEDLCGAGFRFALAHVTDLDMDFDALRATGIQYVKLDAEIFLNGLATSHDTTVPASEVYRFLADKGLGLIVDHISNETQLTRVVENGALYGQGQLFGGPRPIKAEVFAGRSAA